ncbi:MAG: NusG-like protein [Acidobacteria bacterium]|nr:MAG: NusG-like protein [Acidobacteriota bacterium]
MDLTNTHQTYPWFAVQTRARYENFAAKQLAGRGYEVFLPFYHCKRRWSDRMQEFEVPLFPGYLFCRFNLLDRLPILTTPGVIQVVGIGKTPVPVDEQEVIALQTAVKTGLPRQPWMFLKVGQRVRVEVGPLSGLEGVLLTFKGRYRLVLSVTLLQRSVALEVESDWVTPVPQQSGRTAPVSSPLLT